MAFLIPAIERLIASANGGKKQLKALIISPTRELAQQIATEATALTTFHKIRTDCVFGGTNVNSEKRRLENQCPDMLIATPGT